MSDLVQFLDQRRKEVSNLLIFTHDHPDPDSISSAYALKFIAQQRFKIRARIVYGGSIGRVENQMMVQVLKIPIHELRPSRDLKWASHLALVDSQPVFANNSFPARRKPFIVIDHHPIAKGTRADFLMVKRDYGATATILSEMLLAHRFQLPSSLVTALVYGIGSETQNLGREAGPRDVKAYLKLFPACATRLLARIQNPPRPKNFFLTLRKVLKKAFSTGSIVGVHLGFVDTPEVVPQMADFLLTYERMGWSIATGRYKDRLVVSLRTKNTRGSAGLLLKRLVGKKGRAGGHGMIAGGWVSVPKSHSELAWAETEINLANKFIHAVRPREKAPVFINPFARK
jgi:nanoRNase/pAp phosphatase (c-di-AMP/oligoRNAs hydrolase)